MKNGRIYSFRGQIKAQERYKGKFVEWLGAREGVSEVRAGTREEDLQGIDFWVTSSLGERFSVQLKVDFWGDRTGNLPCEAISQAYVDKASKIGAEFDMEKVEFIMFLLIPSGRVLGYRFRKFLKYIIEHYQALQNFGAKNDNGGVKYRTLGCLVPIVDLSHLAVIDDKIAGVQDD